MAKVEVTNRIEDFRIELLESEGSFTVTICDYSGDFKEVVVPDNIGGIPVTVIGDMAFYRNENITSVKFPEALVSIGSLAFVGCTNLTCINLPEGLVTIESGAFEDCSSLADIKLPESLISIEYSAFENCEKLTKIIIPKNAVLISESVFDKCCNLKEIIVDEQNPYFASDNGVLFDKKRTTLIFYPPAKEGDYTVPDSINTIAYSAFENECSELTGLSFPKDLYMISSFHNCKQLRNIIAHENSKLWGSIGGVLFQKDKGKEDGLFCYPQGKDGTNYTVPDSVTWIRDYAFYNCKNLTTITLPEGLERIGEKAFYGCEGLTVLTLPVSLEYIDEGAFQECPNLKTITLSKNTKMGHKALDGFSGKLIYRD